MYNLLQIGKSWQICFTWDEGKKKKIQISQISLQFFSAWFLPKDFILT